MLYFVYFSAFISLYLLLFWSLHIHLTLCTQGATTTPSGEQPVARSNPRLRLVPRGLLHPCDLHTFLFIPSSLVKCVLHAGKRELSFGQGFHGEYDSCLRSLMSTPLHHRIYFALHYRMSSHARGTVILWSFLSVWGNTWAIFRSLGTQVNCNFKSMISLKQSPHLKWSAGLPYMLAFLLCRENIN